LPTAACSWAVVEEIETEAQCNFVQTLNELLGGSWNPANHPWESRRDAMLDVFGKVQGYTMKPALQIHRTDARLLVEALSGRWSYEQDRRDKRTVWHYVANAFSCCADRINPNKPKTRPAVKVKTEFSVFDPSKRL
jgi:hypothetical protein